MAIEAKAELGGRDGPAEWTKTPDGTYDGLRLGPQHQTQLARRFVPASEDGGQERPPRSERP